MLEEMKIDRFGIDRFLSDAGANVQYLSNKAMRADPLFEVEHLGFYKQAGLKYPPDYSKLPPYLHDIIDKCDQRMRELIIYADSAWPYPSGEHGKPEIMDANASMGRLMSGNQEAPSSPWSCGHAPTIQTSAKFVLRMDSGYGLRYTFLHGQDLMAFIGWSSDLFRDKIVPSEHEELTHFAGNAYNGFAAAAVLFGIFQVWPPNISRFPRCLERRVTNHSADESIASSGHESDEEEEASDAT